MNAANVGPYGDAIEADLIPAIERQFRAIGQRLAGRDLFPGGSTGGWESLAAQMFFIRINGYNGAFVACPDPVDFRAFMTVDLYSQDNVFFLPGANTRVEQLLRCATISVKHADHHARQRRLRSGPWRPRPLRRTV